MRSKPLESQNDGPGRPCPPCLAKPLMKTMSATQQAGVKVKKPWIGMCHSLTELKKGPGVKVELERKYMRETQQLCVPRLSWPLGGGEDEWGWILPGFLEHLQQNGAWGGGGGAGGGGGKA